MRIFVTGGTHLVGKRVLRLLSHEKHQVTAAVRSKTEAGLVSRFGAKPVLLNLLKVNDVQAALYGQEVIINLISDAGEPKTWKKYEVIRKALSISLAHGALRNKVGRFIQESSIYIYADRGAETVTEDGRLRYGPMTTSALMAERNALELEKVGITPVVLRFASYYAADHDHTRRVIAFAKLGFFLQNGPMDGHVSMIHADDAAIAVVHALRAPAGVYNICDDFASTRRQSMEALARTLGRKSLMMAPSILASLLCPPLETVGKSCKVSGLKFKMAMNWRPYYPSLAESWRAVVAKVSS